MNQPTVPSGKHIADPPPLLDIGQLHVAVGTGTDQFDVVSGIDLHVGRGEAVGLVGESGCGKSMTARAIMRLLPPAASIRSGSIRLEGTELTSLSNKSMTAIRGARVGMVFQDPATYLNPVLRVGRQISESIERHRSAPDPSSRVIELLEMVQLPAPAQVARRFPHELSGGMRQRVLLAIALAASPSLLIADEPTTALDVTIQAQILALLAQLRRDLDLAVLLISHDLAVVSEVCDRVCVMYAGQIVETGATTDLFDDPHHPYSRGLLGASLRVRTKRPIVNSLPGEVPDPADPPAGCRFASRCSERFDRCDEPPPLFEVGEAALPGQASTRLARCWLHARPPVRVEAQAASGAAEDDL